MKEDSIFGDIVDITIQGFDEDREEITIRGDQFRELMGLCFAQADWLSLHKTNWPDARDGALGQALRPFCAGEYRSYSAVCVADQRIWEKCYLYPATEEVKNILLQHITHLFGRETGPEPEGHQEFLREKYAEYYSAAEKASKQVGDFLNKYPDCTEQEFDVFYEEAYLEAGKIWSRIFDAKDYFSTMEDPCFFRGDEMFFEVITHEEYCRVYSFSDEFRQELQKLGKCMDFIDDRRCSAFSLKSAKDMVWYKKKDS